MQADQTVLSLRPGGGSRGGSRFLGSRFDSSSAAFTDLQLLRPHGGGASSLPSFKTGESRFHGLNRIRYTRHQFLQLREVAIIPEDILKAKQEVDAEFFGEDPSWAHGESNLQNQGQSCYSQPDSRDWHNRSAQFFAPAEERSWERQQDTNQQYKQEQLSSQFGKAQISSNQGQYFSNLCIISLEDVPGDVPELSKANDEDAEAIVRSIQDLFTSWEQVRTSGPSSTSRPLVSSAAVSEENMNILKQSLLEYVSFMDIDVNKASAAKQRSKFELLSAKMVQALELPSLNISSDFKVTLKIIHSEISSLLANNVELRAKETQYVHAVSEKDSLLQEIEKAKVELNEISSEVMVENSLMISLTVEMKELQAKMNDCMARLAAMKCNASQGIERTKSLVERYAKLEVDEDFATELSNVSSKQSDEWGKLREQMRTAWDKL